MTMNTDSQAGRVSHTIPIVWVHHAWVPELGHAGTVQSGAGTGVKLLRLTASPERGPCATGMPYKAKVLPRFQERDGASGAPDPAARNLQPPTHSRS